MNVTNEPKPNFRQRVGQTFISIIFILLFLLALRWAFLFPYETEVTIQSVDGDFLHPLECPSGYGTYIEEGKNIYISANLEYIGEGIIWTSGFDRRLRFNFIECDLNP